MQSTIHALLIGINKYAPESNVSSLRGCVNDVLAMEEYLNGLAPTKKVNIKTLLNDQATKENVINHFIENLCNTKKVTPGDFVLFYFSGHGSYAKTPEVFARYDSLQLDETLVCYDSRLDGHQDLADKELAVLLAEIRSDVQIIVIVDACHSGSISRNFGEDAPTPFSKGNYQLAIRFTPPRNSRKTHLFQEYFFQNKELKVYNIDINKNFFPSSNHIAFSACSREEKAWENHGRGEFSLLLVRYLKQLNANISYKKLFQLCHAGVIRKGRNQNPQLAISGNFDPSNGFLSHQKHSSVSPYVVSHKMGNWILNQGAIHGLQMKHKIGNRIQVCLYKTLGNGSDDILHETVTISKVCFNHSVLNFEHLNTRELFQASIINPTAAIRIYLNGTLDEIDKFKKAIQSIPSIELLYLPSEENADLEINMRSEQYRIFELPSGEFIHGCLKTIYKPEEYILRCSAQIRKYKRLVSLRNPTSQMKQEKFQIDFLPITSEQKTEIVDNKIILSYTGNPIPYEFIAENHCSNNYFIALVHFSNQYGISLHFPCSEFHSNPSSNRIQPLILDDQRQLRLPVSNKSTKDIFKVIVSTQPFHDYHFMENDLKPVIVDKSPAYRKEESDFIFINPEQDWLTKTLIVILKR